MNARMKSNNFQVLKPIVYMILASPFSIDTRVKQELRSLVKHGFYVEVLSWDRSGKSIDILTNNYHIKYVKLLQSTKFSKLIYLISAVLFQFTAFIEGVRLLKKSGKIIVHANDFNTFLGAIFLKFFHRKNVFLVYDSHELTPAVYNEWYGSFIGSFAGKLERIIIKYFDDIIAVSPPIVAHLKNISGKEIHLIWNYPSKDILPSFSKEQARDKLDFSDNTFIIVYAGTLRPDVALMQLLESVNYLKSALKKQAVKLKVVIVGDGPLLSEITNYVQSYDLTEYVEITGRVSRELSLTYLLAADLSYILFTIKGENTKIGMPWKLFESLVSGTKVLVFSNTYAASLVKHFNVGYLVDSLNVDTLANTLLKIIKQGSNVNHDLKSKFLWENQEEKFVRIYLKLATKHC